MYHCLLNHAALEQCGEARSAICGLSFFAPIDFMHKHLKSSIYAAICLAAGVSSWLIIQAMSSPTPPLVTAKHQYGPALINQGKYVFRIAGCAGCHTDETNDGGHLAGGRSFDTPFGTFFSPNISPHPTDGIGKWTLAHFARAMRDGVSPQGQHYYPVFPYTSFTQMGDEDVRAVYSYLMQLSPVAGKNRPHVLPWYMRFRFVNWVWKLLFFRPGPRQIDPDNTASWNRGAYIVNALAHCGECHTPRNILGAMDRTKELAGTANGPDGDKVPNITRDRETGIGKWTKSDLSMYLITGELGEDSYSSAMGLMADVIEDGLQYLRDDDLNAIVDYTFSLRAHRNAAVSKD